MFLKEEMNLNTKNSTVRLNVGLSTIANFIIRKLKKLWSIIMKEPELCYYCGQPASTIDHVIPKSILKQLTTLEDAEITHAILRKRALKVSACRECNCLLSDSLQDSLTDRKQYLKQKLRKRYAKLLGIPKWEDEEMENLGYNLSSYIKMSIKKKRLIRFRLDW